MTSFQQARIELGTLLRRLREGAGLTGKELADRLQWQASKVSRLENARQTASEEDVLSWAAAVQADSETTRRLAEQAATLGARRLDWRQLTTGGLAASQEDIRELESKSRRFRVFEPGVIPGLLQTAEYARNIFLTLKTEYGAAGEIEAGVRVRMQRQEILYDLTRSFHFVLPENALRTKLAPSHVMQGVLDRLMAISTLPTMRLGIIPFEQQLPWVPLTGFWIFDDAEVMVPTRTRELRLRDRQDVEFYVKVFDGYAEAAAYGESARSIIMRVNDEYAKQSEN
ncbi:helix-turn-helix domain-containing protein [Thermoactinospora rubra]|uniref:helix-turn-helix domain-containing protein n=1 Tax=Thermoactinospora rubra TaxID=1088767 RepID=UPI000A106799|nr:helix-turn-helix transcriptional regulator [Thermoactinospora rubra]